MPTPSVTSLPGKGWDLQIAASGSTATVGGVKSVSGPGGKMGTRDVTHLLSTMKEYAPTIGDGGQMTADVMYNPSDAQHVILQGLLSSHPSTGIAVKFIGPTTTKFFSFNAIMTAMDISGHDVEGTVMAKFGFQVNGAITFPTT
jgi:hypothetical protein